MEKNHVENKSAQTDQSGKNDQSSTSSTYAGKAEKGDKSGRVGEARLPNRGEAAGAVAEKEKTGTRLNAEK